MKKKFKKLLAGLLSCAMIVCASPMVPGKSVSAEALPGLADLGRQVAAEGIVLLENPDVADCGNSTGKVLPVDGGEMISVFGRSQLNYYKSGTGSGGAVQVEYTNSILDGLRSNPKVKVNEDLASVYKDWVADHPFDNGGGGWAAEPWSQEEMPLDEGTVADARAKSDVAIVIIGRTAGEDKDNTYAKGAYLLTDKETDMLDKVHAAFDRMVVVLNVGNVIDMSWVANYPKAAVLYAWQGGMKGGDAVADVISGEVTPSGKLSDTIAKEISDYPSDGSFEGKTQFGSSSADYYAEDVYVGYRYFETFAEDRVLYPFGYGLSYTTFEITTNQVTFTEDKVNVDVTVKNTGNVKGKEVVQVYYGAPQGALGKPAKELAAFAKTGILKPQESQNLVLSYDLTEMSSFDDSGLTGHESAYVMEAGDYKIYVGNSVRSSSEQAVYHLDELKVTEQCTEAMVPVDEFKRMKPQENEDGTYTLVSEEVPTKSREEAQADLDARIAANQPEELKQTEKQYKLIDVYNGTIDIDTFVAQMTDSDLASIVLGEGMNSTKVTLGTASCFGGVTDSLLDLGIPIACTADGPSGIRMEVGVQYATSLPNGTLIACTWNLDLVEKMCELWGEEMLRNNIDTILGPGINIHRHPLNGRNFEYFSEDPLLTGTMASAETRGVQKTGATVTLKHFAANNQETNRHFVNSIVSERALREIYLKGYEIAVKDGGARSIMTSYNPINGVWSASNFDMNTTILRKEWGYTGYVMTDWWARMNSAIGASPSTTDSASMVRAQNDVYMPVGNNTAGSCTLYQNGLSAIRSDSKVRAQYQRSAKNICNFLLQSQAFARENNIDFRVDYEPGEKWFAVTRDVSVGNPKLTGITIDGRNLILFQPNVLDYKVFYDTENGNYPEVAGVGDGVEVEVQQADSSTKTAVLTVSAGKEERIYKVIFCTEDRLDPAFENPVYAYLENIRIDGEPLQNFSPDRFSYALGLESQASMPEVTAEAAEGCRVVITTDESTKTVKIRCVSTDQANTYVVKFGSMPQSDEFDSTELNAVWKNDNPTDNLSLTANSGYLRIQAEGGDFWTTHNDLKNFVYQEAFGNWEASVKIELNKHPNINYNGTGIAVFQDMDNYIWLKYEYSSNQIIGMVKETNAAEPVSIGSLTSGQIQEVLSGSSTVYMKLKKIGDLYTGYFSTDGENYTKLGSVTADYAEPKFGILCSNGSTNAGNNFYADFDYVRFDTDADAEAIEIGDDTKIKLTEAEPYSLGASLTEVNSDDIDGGTVFSNCVEKEALAYRINVAKGGSYQVKARVKSDLHDLAQMSFSLYEGETYLTTFSTNGTNGVWKTLNAEVELTQGEHILWLKFDKTGLDMNWLRFQNADAEKVDTTELKALIEQAEKLDLSQYVAASKLASVIDRAKDVAENSISQSEVDETKALLQTTIENLEDGMKVKQEPQQVEERKENGKLVRRVRFHNLPWIWAQSGNFRYEGSNPNYSAGYITTGDIFYLGYMDLTGLEEIRINYANGNTSTSQYQPSVRLNFYTEIRSTGSDPTKGTTHSNSTYFYDKVYRGGSLDLSDYFAGINFLHKKLASWSVYGDSSTNGSMQDPDLHQGLSNYWEVGVKTFLTAKEGMHDVYMLLQEGGSNFRYADFVYSLVNVSFDLNYEGAPETPETVELTKGSSLGEQLPTAPERKGYTFKGWATEDGVPADETTAIREDTILKAQWEKNISDLDETAEQMRASLKKLYDAWAKEDTSVYTPESAEILEAALKEAKAVLDEESASITEIGKASAVLVQAIGKLEYGVQKVHLETVIEFTDNLLILVNNYDKTDADDLKAANEAGKAVCADESATQDEVDAAVYTILDALAKMSKSADVEGLEKLIEAAREMAESGKYTDESTEALAETIQNGEAVLVDPNRADDAIEKAYQAIVEAIQNLQRKGNKAALYAMIVKAEQVLAKSDQYIPETLEGIEEELAAAKLVYADPNAQQPEINRAVKALTLELAEARLRGDVTGDGAVDTADTAELLRASAEHVELSTEEMAAADVNGDGTADTTDAVMILQFAAEEIAAF